MSYVLVIDDDASIREVLGHYFSLKDIDYRSCSTEKNLISILKDKGNPLIIFLDYLIPGENIVSILYSVRNNSQCPVILFSASGVKDDFINQYKFEAVLKKPFGLEQLELILNIFCNIK